MRRFVLRLLTFFRSSRAESELARELEAHLRLLEDDYAARGMSPDEARFAARRAFGGQIEQMKVHHREARSFRLLDNSWLDIKLALRMLVRFPALTIVATLAMATAIAIAAGGYAILGALADPSLPLPDGDRIVMLQFRSTANFTAERRTAREFAEWRGQLRTVEDLGAFRQVERNLILPNAAPELVRVAEMTASGFRVAGMAPLIGRYLEDDDERAGAEPVIVIGQDVWERRFASDPAILGRSVQLGAVTHTIVGVMPGAFRFPISDRYWVPLRVDTSAYPRLEGPELYMFGRLAPDATIDAAQAELTAIGQRLSSDFPDIHARLQPHVVRYALPFTEMDDPENVLAVRVARFMLVLLLALVATNVAILVYARTVTRHGEIAVRSALGASRRRIVAQLFIEALALSLLASCIALTFVSGALGEVQRRVLPAFENFPFWLDFRLTPSTLAYTALLAVVAAAIVGVIPALKATGRHVQLRLQDVSRGGGAGMRLGRTWTALIVIQVAVAVGVLPVTVYQAWDAAQKVLADPGFPAEEFLTAQVVLDRAPETSPTTLRARYGDRLQTLMQRLREDADVRAVSFSRTEPGQENAIRVAVDGVAGPSIGHLVWFNRVGHDWMQAFNVPLLTGRALTPADASGGGTVLVNAAFVSEVLGGGHAVGRQLRYAGTNAATGLGERWHEIVGVVADFPNDASGKPRPLVYAAAAPGDIDGVRLAVHVRSGDALAFAPRLRTTAAAIDPALQLRDVNSIHAAAMEGALIFQMVALGFVVLALSVVALSAAGIYALMSVTVEQRRREIGIRTALGADPRRLLAAVFARALGQLTAGAAFGMGAALLMDAAEQDMLEGHGPVIVPAVALFMMLVGLIAALGPARRGLRLAPTEALRAE